MKVKCEKCFYEWVTKSEMYFVSCPRCGSKVKIKNEVESEVKNE